MKNYQQLASAVCARQNCINSNNSEWQTRWEDAIKHIITDAFPHGSGFDSGTQIDMDKSTSEQLVLTTAFHHMNDGGMYDGWTEHTIFVRGSLAHGFLLTITGKDRNEIKEYIHECFASALDAETDCGYFKQTTKHLPVKA